MIGCHKRLLRSAAGTLERARLHRLIGRSSAGQIRNIPNCYLFQRPVRIPKTTGCTSRNTSGTYLKCKTDVLFLIKGQPSRARIRQKIESADIIYVGGGNTLMMMRLWRRLGVDKLLRFAYANGTILCGISAGSICWFDSGHSDSMSFYNPGKWEYINVKGLGFIKGVHCPHFNGRTGGIRRRNDFLNMVRKIGGMGIAIENNCAIEFIDGRFYRVINSKKNVRAYRVYKNGVKVVIEQIPREQQFAASKNLYRLPRTI